MMIRLLMLAMTRRQVAGVLLLLRPYHFEGSILQCRQLAPRVDLQAAPAPACAFVSLQQSADQHAESSAEHAG